VSSGCLLIELITPEVEPRPNIADAGPNNTSIASALKVSR